MTYGYPETKPYGKDIGRLFEDLHLENIDSPDWADVLLMEIEEE